MIKLQTEAVQSDDKSGFAYDMANAGEKDIKTCVMSII